MHIKEKKKWLLIDDLISKEELLSTDNAEDMSKLFDETYIVIPAGNKKIVLKRDDKDEFDRIVKWSY